MKVVYAGDTPKFPISIQYNGADISPTDPLLVNVEIVVYSRMDSSKKIGKYALNTAGLEGYSSLIANGGKVDLILSAADTAKCLNEELIMQITTKITDSSYPNGIAINTGTAVFCKVKAKE